jgi:hypothetical protein
LTRIIRYIATVVLLWIVWTHAHWSVAIAITGLSVETEITTWLNEERGKLLMELARKFLASGRAGA